MNTTSVTADITLDLKGLTCPGPLLGVRPMLDEMQEGQVLLLISDCPGTRDDLVAWAKQTGNAVVKVEKLSANASGYYLQKGGGAKHTANVVLDMCGSVCPGPIVEAKKLLNGMKPGEVLKLVSDCPGVHSDINGWADSTGINVLNTLESPNGKFEFFLSKQS
jgi:TusA-related sulfurtransferase